MTYNLSENIFSASGEYEKASSKLTTYNDENTHAWRCSLAQGRREKGRHGSG